MQVTRVRDLLLHVPHRYLDFSNVVPIGMAEVGSEVTVVGRVDRVKLKHPKPRMQIVEMYVLDETGVIQATFFRQPWIAEQVHVGDDPYRLSRMRVFGDGDITGFYFQVGNGAD